MAAEIDPAVPLTVQSEIALKPGDHFKECNHCPEMVDIPPGDFLMGSPEGEPGRSEDEGPRHMVSISRQFAVSKFEVTFEEWDECTTDGGCEYVPMDVGGRGSLPVINVSWEDAQIYVTWLSKHTGKTYRLLTEAEWEYAARAQTSQRFFFGDDESLLADYAWFNWNSELRAHPVGTKKPNGFGLFDTSGNVWEWCEDCYKSYYTDESSDGSAVKFEECSRHVMRGGSFSHVPYGVRPAQRNKAPYSRYKGLGFRVARTLERAE